MKDGTASEMEKKHKRYKARFYLAWKLMLV